MLVFDEFLSTPAPRRLIKDYYIREQKLHDNNVPKMINYTVFIQPLLSVQGAPARNLLRVAPSPATAIQIGLKQPAKRGFIIFRQGVDFQNPRGVDSRWRD